MDYLKTVSNFFSHPFIIAIVIFVLGRILINKIIPDKKQKVIEKLVIIKNLIKEVEFIYDRILNTSKSIEKDRSEGKDVSDRDKIFNKTINEELNRMSNLVNEKIPTEKFKIDSEIEIYFDDSNLTEIHNRYNDEFKKIHEFITVKLPEHTDIFKKRFCEFEELSFDELRSIEKKLIDAIKKAKSIRFKSK